MKLKYYLIILFLLLIPMLVMVYSVHAKNLGAKAEKTIGLNYYYGRNGFKRNYSKAVYWFRKAAEGGNANAQFVLARFYYLGQGVKQNYPKAIYWLKKSAAKGNINAQLDLGHIYYYGHVVKQNYPEAAYWFNKAAA